MSSEDVYDNILSEMIEDQIYEEEMEQIIWLTESNRAPSPIYSDTEQENTNNNEEENDEQSTPIQSETNETQNEESASTPSTPPTQLNEQCCVCYSNVEPFNTVKTPCSHYYCNACFFRWIATKPNCAMCRASLVSLTNFLDYRDSSRELNDTQRIITELTKILSKKVYKHNKLIELIKQKRNIYNSMLIDSNMIQYNKGMLAALEPNVSKFYYELRTTPNNSHWTRGFMDGIRERMIKTSFDYPKNSFSEEGFVLSSMKNMGPEFFRKLANDVVEVRKYKRSQFLRIRKRDFPSGEEESSLNSLTDAFNNLNLNTNNNNSENDSTSTPTEIPTEIPTLFPPTSETSIENPAETSSETPTIPETVEPIFVFGRN